MTTSYTPDAAAIAGSQLTAFIDACARQTGRSFGSYQAFDAFAAAEFPTFWRLFATWSGLLRDDEAEPACLGRSCEDARFFPSARLNYADMLLRGEPDRPAITACHGDGRTERLTRGELREKVGRLAGALQRLGVRPGDRVVAIARNNAEVAIAALAAAAIGAPFSSCGVEMGAFATLARFARLSPVVLLGTLRSEPWEHGAPVAARVAEVAAGLPSLTAIVALDDGAMAGEPAVAVHRLAELIAGEPAAAVAWERRPFDHPLFILFSSGTTGVPKCIMHGAGGTLLEHVKEHRLHCDLRPGDKLFYQTSPGWMMWNWQLSALASGVELVLYDGPLRGPETLWRIVADQGVTVFGTSAPYLQYCEGSGISPGRTFDLTALRGVLSTGSILYPRQYDWVGAQVKALPLQSISGGTDIIGCFVLGNPNLPVRRGAAQCRSLGLDVRALPPADDPNARIGELICANPFPSRPVGFYDDVGGRRYHEAYFSQNPGVWTHGDLVEFTPEGGAILHGRSDGVLNIRGVRVGPADIYAILQDIDGIAEAMAVEQAAPEEPGGARLVLLVVLRQGVVLDDRLVARIRADLLARGSASFVPARIADVAALPLTHSGKRSEAAARDALNGRAVGNREALQNPACLDAITAHPALRDPPAIVDAPKREGGAPADLAGDLQAICETAFGVSPVGLTDNIFELGGDSLAILALFTQIEALTQRRLPLEALIAASTIEGLAALLRAGGGETPDAPDADRSVPRVRPMVPADIDPVCRFLQSAFAESGIPAAGWRALFDHGWGPDKPGLGFVLAVGDRIEGVIGTVCAWREINGKSGLVCNLTSWYVSSAYRGWGVALLAAAVQDRDITYTALTPGPVTWQTLHRLGFSRLDERKIIFPPLFHLATLAVKPPVICFDRAAVRASLNEPQRRVFDDHAAHDCLHLTIADGPRAAYVVVRRRVVHRERLARWLPVRGRIPLSEILHCSAPEILARHLERAKAGILARQRTLGLVADARLFSVAPRGLPMKEYTLYRSPVFEARDIDRLYSELVLVPI